MVVEGVFGFGALGLRLRASCGLQFFSDIVLLFGFRTWVEDFGIALLLLAYFSVSWFCCILRDSKIRQTRAR